MYLSVPALPVIVFGLAREMNSLVMFYFLFSCKSLGVWLYFDFSDYNQPRHFTNLVKEYKTIYHSSMKALRNSEYVWGTVVYRNTSTIQTLIL